MADLEIDISTRRKPEPYSITCPTCGAERTLTASGLLCDCPKIQPCSIKLAAWIERHKPERVQKCPADLLPGVVKRSARLQ